MIVLVRELLKKIFKKKNTHSLLLQFISAGLGFASFTILARSLDKDSFGHWVIYITACGFIDVFRYGLTLQAVIRFLAGANADDAKKLQAANWIINAAIAAILIFFVLTIRFLYRESIENSDYLYFFIYYPLLIIASLGSFNSQAYLTATQRFDRMLFIRSFEAGVFTLFILIDHLFFNLHIREIIITQIIIFAVSSLICFLKGWDGTKFLSYSDKKMNKKILHFGKFSTATLMGAHLLRSADTFIIGLSATLGAKAVAVFSIPLKAIEVIEIPVRSFSQTFFPLMSKLSIENKMDEFRKQFYSHTGALTLFLIPFLITGYIFAEEVVLVVGGHGYENAADIFRIFVFFSLIIPLDRFSGIALDSINRPDLNFYKILFMVACNIIGDVIAVFAFKSLHLVAFASLLFLITGVIAGLVFNAKYNQINARRILPEGYAVYKDFFQKILKNK